MLPDRYRPVVEAALRAAGPHGFALGGNAALSVHGLPGFGTKIMELVAPGRAFSDAVKAVEKELRSQGYAPARIDVSAERRHAEPVSPGTLAQWRVPTGGGGPHDHPPIGGITKYHCHQCHEHVLLAMRRAPRGEEPARTSVGSVLHVEDAVGSKLRDLSNRGWARDYADVARLMERWSPVQLSEFAQRLDPRANPARDLDRAAQRLAAIPDIALYGYGNSIPSEKIPQVREKFATWRSDPRDAAQHQAAHAAPDRQARYYVTGKGRAWLREEQQREAEHAEPQRQQPEPTIQARTEPARQAPAQQRRPRAAERDEPERSR